MRRHIMKSISCLMSVNLLVFTGGMSVLPSAFAEDSIKQTEWNGHRYAVIEKELKPLEAEEYCKSLGGHLAAVTSQEEQDFIAGLASEVDYENFWIGASDDSSEGEWYWLNDEKLDYTAWYPGGSVGTDEPNNGLGAGENYCCMNRARDYLWVDAFGGYDGYTTTCYFICEWDSNTNLVYTRSAFERIESEDYDDATDRVNSADNYGTGTCIGWIADKHYIRYNNIDFGDGVKYAIISAAENYYDSELEIHIDALDGECIGVWSIPNTKSWYDFYEYICPVSSVTGVHDVFLICNAEPSNVDVINLDYFTFSNIAPSISVSDFILGDVNEDKIVDGRDATDVLTYYAKSSAGTLDTEFTEKQKKAADYNEDGIIDGRDATDILTYYAKLSTGQV